MARRSSAERNVRSITKLGSKSFAVTIPIEYVRELGWKEKQKVNVRISRGKIIVSSPEP
ncbi:MAG: AbrB/MazE/SpoVT family DNA-binding domain-containing protein [Bacteroidales bacterium]|nr:AbrB/MazE/SpoVT family DNA-binding domain-containing protein [Bacteroidales bacterium]